MSLDLTPDTLSPAMAEAHRQLEICNACRYCEGFCSVFPAMTRQKQFAAGDLTHMANLCHNCRGCYYSCQYSPPHEFALNLPAALAEVRQESWESFIRPAAFARAFARHGLAIALLAVVLIALMGWAALSGPARGIFYDYMPHWLMVSIFLPVFVAPLAVIWDALSRYWRATGGQRLRLADLRGAGLSIAKMKNLSGGQGQGCTFEKGDRYSNGRRHAHQAVMWGFLLCFAATASATLMDYLAHWPAPYGLLTPPKVFGVIGGILLTLGAAGLIAMKLKADRSLGAARVWGGEMAFVVLLALTGLSGLILTACDGTQATAPLLALHLGLVATLFLLMPYSKMVHGFFRTAALAIEEQKRRR